MRLSKTLKILGDSKYAKLYLAAYYWPEDEIIHYAQSLGYGIILPNGTDLTVHVKATCLQVDI